MTIKPRRQPTIRQRLTKIIKDVEALRRDTAAKPDAFQSALTDMLASAEQAEDALGQRQRPRPVKSAPLCGNERGGAGLKW